MQTMHLFAGHGGGLLADIILGHTPVVAVEIDPYSCQVLRERAADGWFPGLSVWEGDVRLFDPSEYKGRVDCIAAGFPCQDISVAGKQAGLGEGTRSGLYREVLRIAGIVKPRYLFLENVSAILTNGLGTVLADLAAMGYDSRWCCIRASDVGAPHGRDRWWLRATRVENTERKRAGGDGGETDADRGRDGQATLSENWTASPNGIDRPSCGEAHEPMDNPQHNGQPNHETNVANADQHSNLGKVSGSDGIPEGMESKQRQDNGPPRQSCRTGGHVRRYTLHGHAEANQVCRPSSERLPQRTGEPMGQPEQDAELADTDRQHRRSESQQPTSRGWESRDKSSWDGGDVPNTISNGLQGIRRDWDATGQAGLCGGAWGDKEQDIRSEHGGRETKPDLGGVADGLADNVVPDQEFQGWWSQEPDIGRTTRDDKNRAAMLKGLGNGIVPLQAAVAWKLLGWPL